MRPRIRTVALAVVAGWAIALALLCLRTDGATAIRVCVPRDAAVRLLRGAVDTCSAGERTLDLTAVGR